MQWYVTSFVTHRKSADIHAITFSAREYWSILLADGTDSAYAKSLELAGQTVGKLGAREGSEWSLDGITELLIVPEAPSEGSELMWGEREYSAVDLEKYIRKKGDLRVFTSTQRCTSNWYICEVVLVEVHDTGSHGDARLVWTNSLFIKARDAESSYNVATDLGNKQASESGTHRCNGDSAHWEFAGLRELIPTIDEPHDGAILWFDEFNASDDRLRTVIPTRSELGAFKWEARSRISGSKGREQGDSLI